jgi:hypothetical protein
MDSWPLPPELPWPRFLRLLRRPDPPDGWLEEAARIQDVSKRPLLLRWIAQHRKCPPHLRSAILPRLPWKILAAIASDGSAHPLAVSYAVDKLQSMWPGLTNGERRTLALLSPKPMWSLIWKARDAGVLTNLMLHPRLSVESLVALIQAPIARSQVEALQDSRWMTFSPIAVQVLMALDRGLQMPESGLVLGMAAPWIKVLEPEERLLTAARMTHPPLRRMTRASASDLNPNLMVE